MTTYSELFDLQNYLKSQTGLNVHIGNDKPDLIEYPIILIIPDENGIFTIPKQDRFITFDFKIKIKLIDNKDRLIKTLQSFDNILLKINNFNQGKGHKLDDNFTTDFTENTYEITFTYILRIRLLNT